MGRANFHFRKLAVSRFDSAVIGTGRRATSTHATQFCISDSKIATHGRVLDTECPTRDQVIMRTSLSPRRGKNVFVQGHMEIPVMPRSPMHFSDPFEILHRALPSIAGPPGDNPSAEEPFPGGVPHIRASFSPRRMSQLSLPLAEFTKAINAAREQLAPSSPHHHPAAPPAPPPPPSAPAPPPTPTPLVSPRAADSLATPPHPPTRPRPHGPPTSPRVALPLGGVVVEGSQAMPVVEYLEHTLAQQGAAPIDRMVFPLMLLHQQRRQRDDPGGQRLLSAASPTLQFDGPLPPIAFVAPPPTPPAIPSARPTDPATPRPTSRRPPPHPHGMVVRVPRASELQAEMTVDAASLEAPPPTLALSQSQQDRPPSASPAASRPSSALGDMPLPAAPPPMPEAGMDVAMTPGRSTSPPRVSSATPPPLVARPGSALSTAFPSPPSPTHVEPTWGMWAAQAPLPPPLEDSPMAIRRVKFQPPQVGTPARGQASHPATMPDAPPIPTPPPPPYGGPHPAPGMAASPTLLFTARAPRIHTSAPSPVPSPPAPPPSPSPPPPLAHRPPRTPHAHMPLPAYRYPFAHGIAPRGTLDDAVPPGMGSDARPTAVGLGSIPPCLERETYGRLGCIAGGSDDPEVIEGIQEYAVITKSQPQIDSPHFAGPHMDITHPSPPAGMEAIRNAPLASRSLSRRHALSVAHASLLTALPFHPKESMVFKNAWAPLATVVDSPQLAGTATPRTPRTPSPSAAAGRSSAMRRSGSGLVRGGGYTLVGFPGGQTSPVGIASGRIPVEIVERWGAVGHTVSPRLRRSPSRAMTAPRPGRRGHVDERLQGRRIGRPKTSTPNKEQPPAPQDPASALQADLKPEDLKPEDDAFTPADAPQQQQQGDDQGAGMTVIGGEAADRSRDNEPAESGADAQSSLGDSDDVAPQASPMPTPRLG
ncbi:hypothetical protein PAPYR_5062 [Paratrimastix pyriformis]|uniref:FHA domain-containing protein n=1 Tax=Paratrimastix pyriformis TaxID=342808 RepID=A0ABQ8UIG1_9EUKA|nr:hypothetical protein PAPYR_5062 [Paratrimastix pyriformis]